MGVTARGGGRRYGGRDAAQRREERRARLIAAGLELFGTTGYAATSVKNICREAGLTERYFYESLRDREDLLATVYDELIREVQVATFAAADQAGPELEAQVRAGLDVFVRTLTDDPRKARIVLIEVVGVGPASNSAATRSCTSSPTSSPRSRSGTWGHGRRRNCP